MSLPNRLSPAGQTGTAKLKEVSRLLDQLSLDLKEDNLSPSREFPLRKKTSDGVLLTGIERDGSLEQLKVFGRDPAYADPIFTKEGIETLARHAFDSSSTTTSRNALRCLANALLLKESTRQIFVDLGCGQKASEKLKNDSWDDEFLLSRLILLTTYGTNINLVTLVDKHHLAENICKNIGRHAKQYDSEQATSNQADPMVDLALGESLKLLFNVVHFCPQRINTFSPALPHVLTILDERPINSHKPLETPMGFLLNSILNLALDQDENRAALFPQDKPNKYVDRLVDILDKSMNAYDDDELDSLVSPVTTVIQKIYTVANPDVQNHMRDLLLPTFDDRKQPLGRGESLSARLLRTSANITTPKIQESTGSLLFELSNKDAKTFVENIGYGYASGFLVRHKITLPENALEAQSASNGESSSASGDQQTWKAVNPITGQTLESEPAINLPEMTDEEKEREAERLFVLFERLKKTGVMDVMNPVAAAAQEGRFEELDDDADSD